MTVPKISILTPTHDRSPFLLSLYHCLLAQTQTDWEWLIYDTSEQPIVLEDRRIHYFHNPLHTLSIGEKRNALIAHAQGEFLVHCDDDDYYAPHYLQVIVSHLQNTHFFKLHSWFNYSSQAQEFFYWGAESTDFHFLLEPWGGGAIPHLESDAEFKHALKMACEQGYGFSFAYRKEVAQATPFEPLNLGEDQQFYQAAAQKGFHMQSVADEEGLVIHRIHHSNISRVFPQYRIPSFVVQKFFPQIPSHFYEN